MASRHTRRGFGDRWRNQPRANQGERGSGSGELSLDEADEVRRLTIS
jgi:hypothetical protein